MSQTFDEAKDSLSGKFKSNHGGLNTTCPACSHQYFIQLTGSATNDRLQSTNNSNTSATIHTGAGTTAIGADEAVEAVTTTATSESIKVPQKLQLRNKEILPSSSTSPLPSSPVKKRHAPDNTTAQNGNDACNNSTRSNNNYVRVAQVGVRSPKSVAEVSTTSGSINGPQKRELRKKEILLSSSSLSPSSSVKKRHASDNTTALTGNDDDVNSTRSNGNYVRGAQVGVQNPKPVEAVTTTSGSINGIQKRKLRKREILPSTSLSQSSPVNKRHAPDNTTAQTGNDDDNILTRSNNYYVRGAKVVVRHPQSVATWIRNANPHSLIRKDGVVVAVYYQCSMVYLTDTAQKHQKF